MGLRQNLYRFRLIITLFVIFPSSAGFGQVFKKVVDDTAAQAMPTLRFYKLLSTNSGISFVSSSFGILSIRGHQMQGNISPTGGDVRVLASEDSIMAMAANMDSVIYFATHDNIIAFSIIGANLGYGVSTFSFPPPNVNIGKVTCLYIDEGNDLYIGTSLSNFYWVPHAASLKKIRNLKNTSFKLVNHLYSAEGMELGFRNVGIVPGYGVYSFAQDITDKNLIWVGTDHGLYKFDKLSNQSQLAWKGVGRSSTITHIEIMKDGNIWISSPEDGLVNYRNENGKPGFVYNTPKIKIKKPLSMRIVNFCQRSEREFIVADIDSTPAIFDFKSKLFHFINDSSFSKTKNTTTDVITDAIGNIFLIKGGQLYTGQNPQGRIIDSSLLAPYIRSVTDWSGEEIANMSYHPELLQKLILDYNRNSILVFYDVNDIGNDTSIHFAYRVGGLTDGWLEVPLFNIDSGHFAMLKDLQPGKYVFELKVKVGDEDWRSQHAQMIIIIRPPFWQTWWFWSLIAGGLGLIIGLLLWWRTKVVKKREREKFEHEKQILELEAKALRAQMNPHFIFNCMNSIKSLIQQDEKEKSISYLTTFSKLIRTLFNNADKKDISLYDEIETCKYYLQLEAMRFDAKFSYSVNVDENIDLKSIQVPALIIQPFIENAIWHGIVPRGNGGSVSVNVMRKEDAIEISIDDDGIGREASAKNKSASNLVHQSKGVNLTQSRLELNNLLQQRQARLEVVDKNDESGKVTGTAVFIRLKEELS